MVWTLELDDLEGENLGPEVFGVPKGYFQSDSAYGLGRLARDDAVEGHYGGL